jgi:hypothetical protein
VGFVRATIDSKTLRGAVERQITVNSNDPEKRQAFLVLRAEVLGSVIVLPSENVSLDVDGRATRLIRQDPTESGSLKIANLETSVPWLKVTSRRLDGVRPPTKDGLPLGRVGDWLLELTLQGEPPPGRSQQWIQFSTGLSREPVAQLNVHAFVQPAVNLPLPSVSLRAPEAGKGVAETLFFSVRRGLDLATLQVEANPSALSARIEPSGIGRFKLTIQWDGTPVSSGEILFRAGAEIVRLPVVLHQAAKQSS